MKKILLLIIIIVVGLIMLVFTKPELTKEIEQKVGFSGATDSVTSIRDTFNNTVTDIPELGELKNGYNDVYSGALDWKDKVVGGIATTKDTIDTVRSTLSGAEDTINQAKDTFDQAKDTIEKTTETFQELKGTLGKVEEIGGAITGSTSSLEGNTQVEIEE